MRLEEEWAGLALADLSEAAEQADLRQWYLEPVGRFDVKDLAAWNTVKSAILEEVGAEVAAAQHLDGRPATLSARDINVQNITGPVGVAQAGGSGNTAHVQQTVGNIDYGDGAEHLETLVVLLERARMMATVAAVEALETAQLALAESRKAKPNRLTLGSLLTGLHHTVTMIMAAPGAAEAVRQAMTAMGW